jgi:hypothetical protein
MSKFLYLIGCAAIVGVLSVAAVGTLFFMLEEKWPLLTGMPESENHKFTRWFQRMSYCVWAVSGLLYIALTYWRP